MSAFLRRLFRNEAITVPLYFWGFWFSITALFFGILKSSPAEGMMVGMIVVIPYVFPIFILSALFDWFLSRKKLPWFFLIAIPLGWLLGLLINKWFSWVIDDDNVHINNELLVFIFAGMYIGFKYIKVSISQRIMLKEEENKRVLSELQLLRSQLNPHFLFNALNSIYSLNLSKSEKAGEAILSLSELMRFHIDSSGKQMIALDKEIEMINQYISLEKLRLDDQCKISVDIKTSSRNIEIPSLILIPFVENAFKHGISKSRDKNNILLKVHVEDDNLEFELVNSIPKSKNNFETHGSKKIGILNTRKRLELHYKGNYLLDIKNDGELFKVTLHIKCNQG